VVTDPTFKINMSVAEATKHVIKYTQVIRRYVDTCVYIDAYVNLLYCICLCVV
jgi:hypothetical protein